MQPKAKSSEESLRFNRLLNENLRRDLTRKKFVLGGNDKPKRAFGLSVKDCVNNGAKLGPYSSASINSNQPRWNFLRSRDVLAKKVSCGTNDFYRPRNTVFREVEFHRMTLKPDTPHSSKVGHGLQELGEPPSNFNDFYCTVAGSTKTGAELQTNLNETPELSKNSDSLRILPSSRGLDDLPRKWDSETKESIPGELRMGQSGHSFSQKLVLHNKFLRPVQAKKLIRLSQIRPEMYGRGGLTPGCQKKSFLLDPSRSSLRMDGFRSRRSHWLHQIELMLGSRSLAQAQPDYYRHKDIKPAATREQFDAPLLEVIGFIADRVRADIFKFVSNN